MAELRTYKVRRDDLSRFLMQDFGPLVVADADGFVIFANKAALEQLDTGRNELLGYQFEAQAGWGRRETSWCGEPAVAWLWGLEEKPSDDTDSDGQQAELQELRRQAQEAAERAEKAEKWVEQAEKAAEDAREQAEKAEQRAEALVQQLTDAQDEARQTAAISDRLLEKMERASERNAAEAAEYKSRLEELEQTFHGSKEHTLAFEREAREAREDLIAFKRRFDLEKQARIEAEEALGRMKATSAHTKNSLEETEGRMADLKRAKEMAQAQTRASETKLRLAQERVAELEALVRKHIPNQEDALLSLLKSKRGRY